MKRNIPNALTLGNLLAGCIGIDLSYSGNLEMAAWCIGIGAAFDFSDGLAARLLNVKSPMGKELDSLADLVTFGLLPAIIMMKLAYNGPDLMPVVYVVFMLTLFAALRLAKFNLDTRQTDQFIGLPTPAVAIFIGSLPFIKSSYPETASYFINIPGILGAVVILSILMVINLPLFSLKFQNWQWQGNQLRFIFLAISILLLGLLQVLAIPLIILIYILLSVLQRALSPNNNA